MVVTDRASVATRWTSSGAVAASSAAARLLALRWWLARAARAAFGFAAWLTFSASTLLQHNAFELKPARLTVINSSYQLTLFLAMSVVIGLL